MANKKPINLNTADAGTLATLPGIGGALAERIVRFRGDIGAFTEPKDILAVPGISKKMYDQFADQVTVDEVPPSPVTVEKAGEHPDADESVPPSTDPDIPMRRLPPQEPAASQTEPAPSPQVIEKESGIARPWLLTVLGALGGALIALLILSLVNGTLLLSEQSDVLRLDSDISAIEERNEQLLIEINGLRERLNQMEALSGRLQEAEADIDAINNNLETVDEQLTTLEEDTTEIRESVEEVREAANRFDGFLTGLRELMQQTVPEPPTPTPTPSPTPPPTDTPEPTVVVVPESEDTLDADATPTRTPRPTRTPTATPTVTNTPTSEPTNTATPASTETPEPVATNTATLPPR